MIKAVALTEQAEFIGFLAYLHACRSRPERATRANGPRPLLAGLPRLALEGAGLGSGLRVRRTVGH